MANSNDCIGGCIESEPTITIPTVPSFKTKMVRVMRKRPIVQIDESKSIDKKTEVKKEKKSAADRREELMKQLKAVENAIAKKRVKIDN